MKKLYVALTLGCLASGNFAMEKGKASKSRTLSELTFQEVAEQEDKDLAVILSSLRSKIDDSTTPNELFIGRNFIKYVALKEINDKLSGFATTYSIAVEQLTIQDFDFAECTSEQIDAFEKLMVGRFNFLQLSVDPVDAKKIETSLGDTEYGRIFIQNANASNGKANMYKLLSFLRRPPVLAGIGIASALIGGFVLFRYMRK